LAPGASAAVTRTACAVTTRVADSHALLGSTRDRAVPPQRARRAGFDGVNVSDHFQPWWEPGESGQAWTLLGAIGQATSRVELGTGVTAPVHRYHPAVVAQFAATVEELNPGRALLGIDSGESLNEFPAGMDWPRTDEQVRRLEEALGIIDRLLDGERRPRRGLLPDEGRLPAHAS
jgi:G6PDH family F420-dependent oxidoreductase